MVLQGGCFYVYQIFNIEAAARPKVNGEDGFVGVLISVFVAALAGSECFLLYLLFPFM